MNIFITDENPYVAAKSLPDKLVTKMAVESAQMLAVFVSSLGNYKLTKKDGTFYSNKAHINHPCTKWIIASPSNAAWLISHAIGIVITYTERYGKVHASEHAILEAAEIFEQLFGSIDNWTNHTEFVRAMPEEYKNSSITTIEAYRLYMNIEKTYAVWTKLPTQKPQWWKDKLMKNNKE